MDTTIEGNQQFQTCNIEKSVILDRLREKGCRITKQREALIDVIFQNECACCKEIYYHVSKIIPDIGMATIYRMMNVLEEIGALKWRNGYRICLRNYQALDEFLVKMDDSSVVSLSSEALNEVLTKGLETCGYTQGKLVKQIMVKNTEDIA